MVTNLTTTSLRPLRVLTNLISPEGDDACYAKQEETVYYIWSTSAPVTCPRNVICVIGKVCAIRAVQIAGRDKSTLKSICIPSSVGMFAYNCFHECNSLSIVAFERGSSLSVIGTEAFHYSWWISSICIPASVEILERLSFDHSVIHCSVLL
jgi:hypothetical protein